MNLFFLCGLSAVIYNSLEHIRRAEGISLFPLPPHLSPVSSFYQRIQPRFSASSSCCSSSKETYPEETIC
jgi:hypothetical protein